ncbi:MAG: hypothetical protein ACQERD_12200 [Campylobacterota bacterium]
MEKNELIEVIRLLTFKSLHNETINNLSVKIFELDENSPGALEDLKSLLTKKIKSMNIHQPVLNEETLPKYHNIPSDFITRFEKAAQQVCNPHNHQIPAFDVRRSRVSEFMSQVYLEKEMGCVFLDECDKRMNLNHFESDKHAPGIDVVGFKEEDGNFKFVVCEVKTSSSNKVPCDTAKKLKEDIVKATTDQDRVIKEILTLVGCIQKQGNSDMMDKKVNDILTLLLGLVDSKDSKEQFFDKIVFMPFLIKNNTTIKDDENTDDMELHSDIQGPSKIEGFLWSFNSDITDFVKEAYNLNKVDDA